MKCEYCGEEKGELEWLWPDERWICPRCLRSKINKVIAGKNS